MRRVNFKRAIVWRGHSCISSCPLGSWALKSNEDEPGFAAHRAPKATGSESGFLCLGERRLRTSACRVSVLGLVPGGALGHCPRP